MRLARFVKRMGEDDAYVGRMRNATTQLSALDQMPQYVNICMVLLPSFIALFSDNSIANEYGILLQSWTVGVLADRRLRSPETDYVASERSTAGLGAVLFSTEKMIQPVDRPNYFVTAWPGFKVLSNPFY